MHNTMHISCSTSWNYHPWEQLVNGLILVRVGVTVCYHIPHMLTWGMHNKHIQLPMYWLVTWSVRHAKNKNPYLMLCADNPHHMNGFSTHLISKVVRIIFRNFMSVINHIQHASDIWYTKYLVKRSNEKLTDFLSEIYLCYMETEITIKF